MNEQPMSPPIVPIPELPELRLPEIKVANVEELETFEFRFRNISEFTQIMGQAVGPQDYKRSLRVKGWMCYVGLKAVGAGRYLVTVVQSHTDNVRRATSLQIGASWSLGSATMVDRVAGGSVLRQSLVVQPLVCQILRDLPPGVSNMRQSDSRQLYASRFYVEQPNGYSTLVIGIKVQDGGPVMRAPVAGEALPRADLPKVVENIEIEDISVEIELPASG